jgi:hypothetical protein
MVSFTKQTRYINNTGSTQGDIHHYCFKQKNDKERLSAVISAYVPHCLDENEKDIYVMKAIWYEQRISNIEVDTLD